MTLIVSLLLSISIFGQGIIIDHNCVDITQIPSTVITDVKNNIKWHYAHMSHGQQLINGMDYIEAENSFYGITWGVYLPAVPNNLCVYNGNCGYQGEQAPAYWTPTTCTFTTLNQNPALNVSQFEWCEDLDTYSEAQVNQYLNALNTFGQQYPNVTFVYTTGTAQNGGSAGYNRHLRNQQIRAYCIANNKILYDFADIDSWYNDSQSTYLYNGQQIPIVNPAYLTGGLQNHINQLGATIKGKGAWWLMARIRGWDPNANINVPPSIENQSFTISENDTIGTIIGTVLASDPNPDQTLIYSIIDGNINNTFNINPSTGVLALNNSINYEILSSYSLSVKVQDNGMPSLFAQATIIINILNINEIPNIQNQVFSINENATTGTIIGIVLTSDPDAGQILIYSIIDGNTNNTFSIDSNTGALTLNNLVNYETLSLYSIIVNVQDNGSPSLSSQAMMTINVLDTNEQPIIQNQSFSINFYPYPYPYPSILIPVGQIIASDPDIGQSLIFLMTQGNQAKIIVDQSGKIFYNILSAEPIGIEEQICIEESIIKYKKPQFIKKYNIMVQVSDNFNPPASSTAAIDITVYSKTISQIYWWIENDILFYKFPFENEDFGKFNLSNMYGITICEGWCYPGTNQINISTLSGLYMLTITGGETGEILLTKIMIL